LGTEIGSEKVAINQHHDLKVVAILEDNQLRISNYELRGFIFSFFSFSTFNFQLSIFNFQLIEDGFLLAQERQIQKLVSI
jgi:hypothetical protein